ncbi:hypothetical protein, partial [Novosphingobium sp. LASN5T]|uniref:hypothetical protein n=1 Tax=Novosphingobium sp. LASN5T TaxID=2491021 RepID=UPI001CC1CD78
ISARTSSANARKRGNGQPRKSDGDSTPSSKGRSRSNDIPAPYTLAPGLSIVTSRQRPMEKCDK